jgi:Fe-S-cluster containining protein
MSKDSNSDWRSAYEAFDGRMNACLGKACSTPCCNLKTTPTWGKGSKQYYTSLDTYEYKFQTEHFGPFDPEIQIDLVDVGIDRGMELRYLIRGCLAGDGTCRLRDRKPMQCRIFPLSLSELLPIRISRCPQSIAIASCPDTQECILAIRNALGRTDNEKWKMALDRMLQETDSL